MTEPWILTLKRALDEARSAGNAGSEVRDAIRDALQRPYHGEAFDVSWLSWVARRSELAFHHARLALEAAKELEACVFDFEIPERSWSDGLVFGVPVEGQPGIYREILSAEQMAGETVITKAKDEP